MNRRHSCALVAAMATMVMCAFSMGATANGDTPSNVHFSSAGSIALPGMGLSVAWAPSGTALATGGHFADPKNHVKYDTRTVNLSTMSLQKSFDCHGYWAITQTWSHNPYIGDVIADGGGDHAVKIWNANAAGSKSCDNYQFKTADGGVHQLANINGWITSLQFSPDGRYLAGASRDDTVRVWQIAPGPNQWKVVRLWYDKAGGNYLSVRWSPDGQRLLAGDRAGRVSEWPMSLWNQSMIDEYATVKFPGQPTWFAKHSAALAFPVLWIEGGHKDVWNARYSPDGNKVVAGGFDGVLTVYAARTGHVLYRVHAPNNTAWNGLDWSPDGALIAAGGQDHNIYMFNASNGTLYDKLVGSKNGVSAVAWSPNGRTLASTAGGQRIQLATKDVVHSKDDTVRLWTRH